MIFGGSSDVVNPLDDPVLELFPLVCPPLIWRIPLIAEEGRLESNFRNEDALSELVPPVLRKLGARGAVLVVDMLLELAILRMLAAALSLLMDGGGGTLKSKKFFDITKTKSNSYFIVILSWFSLDNCIAFRSPRPCNRKPFQPCKQRDW